MSPGNPFILMKKVKGQGHTAQNVCVGLQKKRNIAVCCWNFPATRRAADTADCWYFRAWSFLQSSSTSVGHGAVESARCFEFKMCINSNEKCTSERPS